MLPDCLGRKIPSEFLTCKIEEAGKRYGFKFINEEVSTILLDRKEVFTLKQNLNYDYLVISSGSETNFYGNENIRKQAYKLDDTVDVGKILNAVKENSFTNYIICGGGYTGIEVATNLRLLLKGKTPEPKVVIIEKAASILGPLPEWMKGYVSGNLQKLGIEVYTDSAMEKIELGRVSVTGGKIFERSLVIWAAGVKTPSYVQGLKVEKNPQGRIKVDNYLRLNDSCFVVGDCAYFSHKDTYLRMAIQFAITQGECAALNILSSIAGRKLSKYQPLDLGYIIPMANNRSCGRVLGINLTGRMATVFHFIMCIYRSCGLKNKLGILANLIARD
jgi:NADH dehydrogenase